MLLHSCRGEGLEQQVLQIHVMFNNKEVNNARVANESFCQLQRQKFRQTLTPRIFWSEEKCYKTCKSFVTLSSFCRPYPHSFSEFDSLVFYYIRPFQYESLVCFVFLFLCSIPQSQLDTVVGPHSIRSIRATRDSVLSNWPLFKRHVLKVTNHNQSYPILLGHFFPAKYIICMYNL